MNMGLQRPSYYQSSSFECWSDNIQVCQNIINPHPSRGDPNVGKYSLSIVKS